MKTPSRQTHSFSIEKLDPHAQGIHHQGTKIHFVAKTLPGEKGVATITKNKSKATFSSLNHPKDLSVSSPERLLAPCPFYNSCHGCQYQHVSYETELEFKGQSFKEQFQKAFPSIALDLKIIGAKERFFYRNRLVLHYDLLQNRIGLMDPFGEILSIDQCLLAASKVASTLHTLINPKRDGIGWQSYLVGAPLKGVLEVYERDGKVQVVANKGRAVGGFTQVNPMMNQVLREEIQTILSGQNQNLVVDLFGGDGNLSHHLAYKSRVVIDQHVPRGRSDASTFWIEKNLFQSDSKQVLGQISRVLGSGPWGLMIDPPRSGFPQLPLWMDLASVSWLLYVSCNPSTLLRDLMALFGPRENSTPLDLKSLQKAKFVLLDLFPATAHYEVLAFLPREVMSRS